MNLMISYFLKVGSSESLNIASNYSSSETLSHVEQIYAVMTVIKPGWLSIYCSKYKKE